MDPPSYPRMHERVCSQRTTAVFNELSRLLAYRTKDLTKKNRETKDDEDEVVPLGSYGNPGRSSLHKSPSSTSQVVELCNIQHQGPILKAELNFPDKYTVRYLGI